MLERVPILTDEVSCESAVLSFFDRLDPSYLKCGGRETLHWAHADPSFRKEHGMDEIVVTPVGPREFEVTVGSPDTEHRVTVPEGMIGRLDLPEDDLEKVVRESFAFLLEREPASSIMSEFSLDVISNYFPEYERELPKRL